MPHDDKTTLVQLRATREQVMLPDLRVVCMKYLPQIPAKYLGKILKASVSQGDEWSNLGCLRHSGELSPSSTSPYQAMAQQ
jgi:hypothetical protein